MYCSLPLTFYYKAFKELCSPKNQRKKILETPFAHELSLLVTFLSLFHTPKIQKNSMFVFFKFPIIERTKGFVVFGISLGWLVGWVGLVG
jgi:hypothetical protein